MSAAQLRPVGWDGPDDSWQDSDAVFESFLRSFQKRDLPALRSEGRITADDRLRPTGSPIVALRDAITDPTNAKWRALRAYSDRDLASAMRAINETDHLRNIEHVINGRRTA